jgi:NAD(P)-dependent dehydrogenase (short-subunit alcohol dehydrogenase family)
MEFFALEQAKLAPQAPRPLENQVVVISGAAGAIGSAVAEVCAEAGAYVALTDIDVEGAARAAERIGPRIYGRAEPGRAEADRAVALRMDVTDEASVRTALDAVARHFGGVDVIVPNAGVAHVSNMDELSTEEFNLVMDVNAVGCLNLIREGTRELKRQALGGNIVIISSKNVFSPGAAFGAYSASKAAGHQLGRVAAIELAAHGIRVNMINPDAIFGDVETPSGLWKTVGGRRAEAKGVEEKHLPEYYRARNLLKARVTGRHVGNAVVFFASNATPTTGASLPVDGGLPEAFPR